MIGGEHSSLDHRLWPSEMVRIPYIRNLGEREIVTRLWSMISVMTAILPVEGPDLRRTTL